MSMNLTHIKTIKWMKEFFLFSLIIFHWMGCKDKEPITPKPDPTNQEYTFKGKLINGTYNTPINPGMVMTAVVSHTDVFNSKSEELATFRIGQDGGFEFKYKHSKLAENNSATLKLTSQFFVSDPLPKNRDVDTILYRSTWGTVVMHLIDVEPFDKKLYWAHYFSQDSLISEDPNLASEYIMILNPLKLLMELFVVVQSLL